MENRADAEAVKAVGLVIRTKREGKLLDRAPTAIAAGLNDRTLGRIEAGTQDDGVTPYRPKAASLLKIMRHLEIDPEPHFAKLGYTMPKEDEMIAQSPDGDLIELAQRATSALSDLVEGIQLALSQPAATLPRRVGHSSAGTPH